MNLENPKQTVFCNGRSTTNFHTARVSGLCSHCCDCRVIIRCGSGPCAVYVNTSLSVEVFASGSLPVDCNSLSFTPKWIYQPRIDGSRSRRGWSHGSIHDSRLDVSSVGAGPGREVLNCWCPSEIVRLDRRAPKLIPPLWHGLPHHFTRHNESCNRGKSTHVNRPRSKSKWVFVWADTWAYDVPICTLLCLCMC